MSSFSRWSCTWVLVLAIAAPACGKKSPSAPDTNTNCSVIVGNKGTVTAQVNGATFTGITPTGGAMQTSGALTAFGQTSDNTTLTIGTTPVVGTLTLGAGIVSPATLQIQTRSCSGLTGYWLASIAGGSGSITVTSITATGASGTFSGTLLPQPGSGATGNKVIERGEFTVTF